MITSKYNFQATAFHHYDFALYGLDALGYLCPFVEQKPWPLIAGLIDGQ